MGTPKHDEIVNRAVELWKIDRLRSGQPYEANPELEELKEEGFILLAQQELMRHQDAEYKAYIEKEARELGIIKDDEGFEVEKPIEEVLFSTEDALCSGFAVFGNSGCGKTNLTKWLVHMLIQKGVNVYVLDSSRQWNKEPTPIGNCLEISSGRKSYSWNRSTVFDISRLSLKDKVAFANLFCQVLLKAHMNGYDKQEVIIFEECQLFIPNHALRNHRRYGSILGLVSMGRNYNLRCGFVSQFPSYVDKYLVRNTQQRYYGWMWEPNDLRYVKQLLGKRWSQQLSALEVGEFVYQNKAEIQKIKVPMFGA